VIIASTVANTDRHGDTGFRPVGAAPFTQVQRPVCDTSPVITACSRSRSMLVVVVSCVAALAACGGSASESGVEVIEGELGEEIGLGDLDATCNEPDELNEGETFTCTATTADEQTIEFLGTMTSDDEFDIVTTNLLTAADVEIVREEAARVLSAEIGVDILPADIECPEGSVVLDEVGDFLCAITDTTTGDVYDLTVSTGGLEPGVGARELSFLVGDAPR
jgi:hypothetical protein